MLTATAVPTIQLSPQDRQQVQSTPDQRAPVAKRERKRAVAEAIGSAGASEQQMDECRSQLLHNESSSSSRHIDEVIPPQCG